MFDRPLYNKNLHVNTQLSTTNLTSVLTFPRGVVDGAVSVDGAPHVAAPLGDGRTLGGAAHVHVRLP